MRADPNTYGLRSDYIMTHDWNWSVDEAGMISTFSLMTAAVVVITYKKSLNDFSTIQFPQKWPASLVNSFETPCWIGRRKAFCYTNDLGCSFHMITLRLLSRQSNLSDRCDNDPYYRWKVVCMRLRPSPQASQTPDSRNQSSIDDLCACIEENVTT